MVLGARHSESLSSKHVLTHTHTLYYTNQSLTMIFFRKVEAIFKFMPLKLRESEASPKSYV